MSLEVKHKNSNTKNLINCKKINIIDKLKSEMKIKDEKKSLFTTSKINLAESNSVKKNDKIISKQTSKIEFRNTDIDKYITKSNNTSLSNMINNNTCSVLDEYKSSRLGDSMLKIRGSLFNQNNSENNKRKKSLLFGNIKEEEKNEDYLKSSVLLTISVNNENNLTKNSYNYPPINPSIKIPKSKLEKNSVLINEFHLLTNNYSQLRESFKASLVSLALNNNLNSSNLNLDLSQSQILLHSQRDSSINNCLANSTSINNLALQRKNSDVALSINPKHVNYKRFTNNYTAHLHERTKVEIVNKVCEYSYLKQYSHINNLGNNECNIDDDYDNCGTEEFVEEKINQVKIMEVKESLLNNENDIINFKKIVQKYYSNECDETKLRILEKELKSIKKKMTELNRLEILYQDLTEKLDKTKTTYSTNPNLEINNENDIDLINQEINNYQRIFKSKCQKYNDLIRKLKEVIGDTADIKDSKNIELKMSILGESSINVSSNNNFMTSIRSAKNKDDNIVDQKSKEILDLVSSFHKINFSELKFEVSPEYQKKMKNMTHISSKNEGDKKINIYSNNIIETIYSNRTVKRDFSDGYVIYYFEKGDIKMIFPDKTKYYFYQKNRTYEYDFEKTLGYKLLVTENGCYEQIYSNGTRVSMKNKSNKLKIFRNNEVVYY